MPVRINAIRLGRLDQAIKVGTGVRPIDGVAEKEILSADDKWADRIFQPGC